jgi:hypothetical protein
MKRCPSCSGQGVIWTDCGDSTCDCEGSTYACRRCDHTGEVPDYEAAYQAFRRLTEWLNDSCNYWMGRANVPQVDEDEAVSEVMLAFDDDPDVQALFTVNSASPEVGR